jgi:hypothetical protein
MSNFAGSDLKKISSKYLFFTKYVFPTLWFGILAFVMVIVLINRAYEETPIAIVVPCFLSILGYFVMKKLVWDLVDEVYDCGDLLLVRNRGVEDRVPLSNIMNVSATLVMNPPRITLRLVKPGKFGSEIAFVPVRPFTMNPFAKNQVVDDLIIRVDKARSTRSVR